MASSFKTILPTVLKRPPVQATALSEITRTIATFRSSYYLGTWLATGALSQTLLLQLLPLSYALVPASLLLAYRLLTTLLVTLNVIPNPYMSGAVMARATAQLPDRNGIMPNSPAAESCVVFLLGAQCNHPLAMLAPGYKDLYDWFMEIAEELNGGREEGKHGYMGSHFYSGSTQKDGVEIVTIFYFRSVTELHAFAHGPLHMKAWKWWDNGLAGNKYPHIGIWHETYSVDKGRHESFYGQCIPTGLGALAIPRRVDGEEKGGRTEWVRPLVRLQKTDKMTNMRGRFAMEF